MTQETGCKKPTPRPKPTSFARAEMGGGLGRLFVTSLCVLMVALLVFMFWPAKTEFSARVIDMQMSSHWNGTRWLVVIATERGVTSLVVGPGEFYGLEVGDRVRCVYWYGRFSKTIFDYRLWRED